MSLFLQCCIFGLVFAVVVAGVIGVIAVAANHSSDKGKEDWNGLAIITVGVVIVSIVVWVVDSADGSHVAQPPASPNYGFDKIDEYDAAKHFIQAQYPGAQTFSSCDDSTVQASPQGDCIITIAVGGVNGFNAPIRDTLTVFMKFQDGRFGLQRIDSQNEAGLVQQQIKDGY